MISVRGASEHNLKAIDVDIPDGSLTVVTGVSGSGKSSLAFDTVCAEGRRRYLETFSSYARQFLVRLARPAVTRIDGLSPAVALDQSANVASPRSTVGTITEIYDLLRLLWARRGRPATDSPPKIDRALFSFNSPRGACPRCKGLGVEDALDPDLLVADPSKSVRDGALRITTPTGYLVYSQVTLDVLEQVCRAHGFALDIPWKELAPEQRDVILNGSDRIRIPFGKHPLASRLRWKGITAKPREEGVYKGILPVMEQILRAKRNKNILRFVRSMPCRACGGTRLRPEALGVTFRGLTIAQAAGMSIAGLRRFFENEIEVRKGDVPLDKEIIKVEEAVGAQVVARCEILQKLGLGYLTLDRESTTLSAGEAQRLRLGRLAGIDLRGVLYVFDEPSVGLHHRDTQRLLEVLRTIRDRGNTVLVVEHDEQAVRAADWIVDIGPRAGAEGGELLYSGPAGAFLSENVQTGKATARLSASRTHSFITGIERIEAPVNRRDGGDLFTTNPITRHNLRSVTAAFRCGALNVVTGVSGAGKSTLVDETSAQLRGTRRPFDKIIAIDQTAIGRTPRSNPATYTGVFDFIRDLFAAQAAAVERGFGKGRFSFNVKGGRCEVCEGAGVLQIGMHFLGAAAVTCEACEGRRFNDETLAVTVRGLNIHDVLEMSIADASTFFADHPPIRRIIDAMCALGLGYLRLGHPSTMLSGGEAQRVKLASELARPGTARTLYLLDEPTRGLHPADVAVLLRTLDALIRRGGTVITIEHDLNVIRTADWIVDVGPGSGLDGGRIVAAGTPAAIEACEESVTGRALREDAASHGAPPAPAPQAAAPIRLTNVTTHNLQHIDVEMPANRLTVITGVSGSGKSSLAFDTLFAEGQQRFLASFSTYARRFINRSSEAEFEDASGLTPAIAVSQRAASRNPRSTVGTLTEIHDHYRVLYSRFGVRACPLCGTRLNGSVCPQCGFRGQPALTASMFSPNSEHGACPRCKGLGFVLDCDPARLITNPALALAAGAMAGHKSGRFYGDPRGQHMAMLAAVGAALGLDFSVPFDRLDQHARAVALRGTGDRVFDVDWKYARGNRTGVHRFQSTWPGLLAYVREEYERKHADRRGEAMQPLMMQVPCDACGGGKLKPEFLGVRFRNLAIHELLALSVDGNLEFVGGESPAWPDAAADLRRDVAARLSSLHDAGLGYLTLDRRATTLSGGEAQRVRVAAAPGAGLTGITYVLDEPTVGLHPRDTARLVALLHRLRDAGNTVVVVEHDRDVIAAADHVVEIGPAAGTNGGRVVAQGSPAEIVRAGSSRTAAVLARNSPLGPVAKRRSLTQGITIRGGSVHNLRDLDVEVPAGGLVCVTGVSGSGKSTLAFEVVAPSVKNAIENDRGVASQPVNCRACTLHAPFASIVRVEPSAVLTSPWSTVATYTGVFDGIRDVFARTETAVARGLKKKDFALDSRGGRCERCEGLGQVRISMDFLPDVRVTCEECGGARYQAHVLECRVGGRSIADVLETTVDEARGVLKTSQLDVLHDLGLGYLTLGQPARTLSGGERQRLALATQLLAPNAARTLYLLDEPTVGLHADDVSLLLGVFDRLIDAGHTLIVIEHNTDVIAAADWVIDLGPEGGNRGGDLVAAGRPEAIAECESSYTGRALRGARS